MKKIMKVDLFSDSAFKQQRLPAWQPILTASTVLPTFFVIGIAFIPVGIVLLNISDQVQEFSYDYTDCTNSKGVLCSQVEKDDCTCTIPFTLNHSFEVSNSKKYLDSIYLVLFSV